MKNFKGTLDRSEVLIPTDTVTADLYLEKIILVNISEVEEVTVNVSVINDRTEANVGYYNKQLEQRIPYEINGIYVAVSQGDKLKIYVQGGLVSYYVIAK